MQIFIIYTVSHIFQYECPKVSLLKVWHFTCAIVKLGDKFAMLVSAGALKHASQLFQVLRQ